MATWEDGAAYAPIERPDGFATPVADPMPSGAAYRAETPGPMAQPDGFEPMAPQQPLREIGATELAARDPRDAFAVASTLLTEGPDGAASPRDPRQPFPSTAQSPLDTAPPPPTGMPLAPPEGAPVPPPGGLATPLDPASFPPPAGPQALAATPRRMQPAPAADQSIRALARVAGGLCFLGFIATGTAIYMLIAAGLIGLRTKALTKALGLTALTSGAGGLLLRFMLSSYDWRTFNFLWSLMALGCAIGFMIYSFKER